MLPNRPIDVITIGRSSVDLYGAQVGGRLEDMGSFRKYVGGSPANFLDIGGGANAEVMASALEVINSDPKVRAIFINIFGGITRGDDVANGIVTALGRVDIASPIVIRLDGTNAEAGREILATVESDMVISSPTMLAAARQAVLLASTAQEGAGL